MEEEEEEEEQTGNRPVDSVSDLLNLHLRCFCTAAFLSCGALNAARSWWLQGTAVLGHGGDVTPARRPPDIIRSFT